MWNRMGYMVVFSHLEEISNVALLLSLIVHWVECIYMCDTIYVLSSVWCNSESYVYNGIMSYMAELCVEYMS